jgi:hypothetical protein
MKNVKMKKLILSALMLSFVLVSCGSDDDSSGDDGNGQACQTCASYTIEIEGETTTVPALEVCEGENGNAFVASIDTDIVYAEYLLLQELLTTCE